MRNYKRRYIALKELIPIARCAAAAPGEVIR